MSTPAPPERTPPEPTPPEPTPPEPPQWRGLDPRMIVVRPLNELASTLPLLFGALVVGSTSGGGLVWPLAVVALLLVRGLVHWLTTRYRITGEQVELHTGLLVRKRLALARDRIRTVESTAKLGHRLFGLATVRMGTGQNDGGGFELDAVQAAEAERLRTRLLQRSTGEQAGADSRRLAARGAQEASQPGHLGTHDSAAPESVELARMRPSWWVYGLMSLSGLAAVGVLVGIVLRFADELDLAPDRVSGVGSAVDSVLAAGVVLVIPVVALGVVLVGALGSLLIYLVEYWGFVLTREPDRTVRARYGLLTTRSVSVEERRLRGIALTAPLVLRIAGGARSSAIATGLSASGESHLLMPPAPLAEVTAVSARVLRQDRAPHAGALHRHPAAALRRRLVRVLLPVGLVALALGVLQVLAPSLQLVVSPWWWLVFVLLVPGALALALDRYRALGHALSGEYLTTRSGSMLRSTVALQRGGVLGWRVRQSLFQRRAGLITLSAMVAAGAGAYSVLEVGRSEGLDLAEQAVPGLLAPFLTVESHGDQELPR